MTNPPAPLSGGLDNPGASPTSDRAPALAVLASVTTALRGRDGNREITVEKLIGAIESALAPGFATRSAVYVISTDGARMRTVTGAPDPWGPPVPGQTESASAWQPASGPISDVLAVQQPIELGIVPTSEREARSFARVVPIWHRKRIVAVVAAVRDAPMPLFSSDDRVVLDALAERIEHAFSVQDLHDQWLSASTSPVSSSESGAHISEALFNRLAEHGGEVVFRHRFSAGTEYVSAGVRVVLGYEPSEFLNDPGLARRIVHPEDRHLLTRLAEDIDAYNQQHLLRTVTRDGTVVWQLLRARPVTDGSRVIGIEGIATDVSMMKRTEAELSHQARSDPLTNLANRLTLREYISRSLARLTRHPGSIGLLYLDLTGFKAVNDNLGHPAGDQAIITVAERLAKVTRREDVVARVGGDEFAVLIPDLGEVADATATAQRIIASLEMPIDIGGQEVRISTGVGIAVTNRADADVDELLANADAALLAAKRSGRGRWQLFQGPSGNVLGADRSDRSIVSPEQITPGAVRAAFASGSFRVFYSPFVDVRTGRSDRVEALLRWEHPELGLLDAEDFLDACEQAELIHSIDDWVLAQSCRQVAQWNEQLRSPMGLAVNATPSNLARPGFGDAVVSTLAATGLSPRLLTVEIPEPAITDLATIEINQFELLRRAGVRVSVDRFGLGSTSIRALRRVPIDEIKLDRTLVAVLDPARAASDVDVEITRLAMQVSQSFGADTVAVGVEQYEQATALIALGCTRMQGHLFEHALPAEELGRRFTDGALMYPAIQG